LAGVNDDPEVMTALMRKLLAARVRPYYLHHPDPIKGTAHFRVPLERGLSILEALRGRLSGMDVPQYMIDLPGGGGKVPLLPQYVQDHTGRHLVVYNFEKKRYTYPL
ncbi:MAG: lysine 2,3-aminomutase, partial [Desulfosalsimonas sp.]